MLDRIRGVLALQSETFNEIEHDPAALGQAVLVVIIASLLAAVGGGAGQVLFGVGIGVTGSTTMKIIATAGWAIIAWLLWSFLTHVIGTRAFDGQATLGEMMRVIGFAYTPLVFSVGSFIPIVGIFFYWGAIVWAIAAAYVGVKEGLDLGNRETFITVAVGGLLYLIGMGVLLAIL